MNIFPRITREKQKLYEKIYSKNKDLINDIPCICGFYGRACRQMEDIADRMLCTGCTLVKFIMTVEAILEVCDKKSIGIDYLYDSDIYDIQKKLQEKNVRVGYTYIVKLLERGLAL